GRCSVTRIFVLLACLGESTAVLCAFFVYISCFFFNGPAPTAIYSLSLHDALPIYLPVEFTETRFPLLVEALGLAPDSGGPGKRRDRKSTRLNSSHVKISYAVFCLKKKTQRASASRPRHTHRLFRLHKNARCGRGRP